MVAGQSRMMPLCLYFLLAPMANLIFQKNAFLLGASLPGPPIFEAISHYPSLCYLPPESGICPENRTATRSPTVANEKQQMDKINQMELGPSSQLEDYETNAVEANGSWRPPVGILLTRYYFDAVTAQCYPFGAQECGGNENRFETHAECMAKCKTY